MTRVAWMTDIHLNFVKATHLDDFIRHVKDAAADVILISGDIAEATDVTEYLRRLDRELAPPIYFVLGNHDFYFGSIREVRDAVDELCTASDSLIYLTHSEPIQLAPDVGLVGHDGWADARIGDYERSMVMMNDYRLITELAGVDKRQRWEALKELGDAAAARVRDVLPEALEQNRYVYFLTHVPPFREACWYDGQISDDEWAPHFTCKAMGDTLLDIMRDYPDRHLTVLCGHTHGSGETSPLENLRVFTGGAEYGFPSITRLFTIR